MSTHNLCFQQKYEKYQIFLSVKFQFLEVKFSIYLHRHVFVMSSASTRFSYDLAWWSSLWHQVTQLDLEIIQRNILSIIYDDYLKNVTSGVLTRFSADWARRPSFWPKWPSFELDLELIKTNILSKIHEDCFKNVTARVLTRFSFDLAWWPRFWPQENQFQTWSRNHQYKQFEQDSWWLLEKCDL